MDNKMLLESIQLLEKLSKGRKAGEPTPKDELEAAKPSLLLLLEYLIKNLDNANVDQALLITLMRVLNLRLSDIKCEEGLEKEGLEKEEEISEERKKQLLRFLIYEMYKITNPNRLAGENALENFINNVQTRGIEVAQLCEGAENVALFSAQELQNAESHRYGFVESLRSAGVRGGGRGL